MCPSDGGRAAFEGLAYCAFDTQGQDGVTRWRDLPVGSVTGAGPPFRAPTGSVDDIFIPRKAV
jgi:hypothetical protein